MTRTTTALGNNVKVSKFIKHLNSRLTKEWKGKKFSDIGKLHNHIKVVTEQALNEFGIEGLVPNYWNIVIYDIHENIFKYEIDRTEDKRYKHSLVGTVNKIRFFPIIELGEDATVDDLIRAVQKDALQRYIGNVNKYLAEAKEQVEQCEKDLVELKSLLRKFE
jgi:hypothetical protein